MSIEKSKTIKQGIANLPACSIRLPRQGPTSDHCSGTETTPAQRPLLQLRKQRKAENSEQGRAILPARLPATSNCHTEGLQTITASVAETKPTQKP